jgi:hypothetical protein
MAHWDPLGSTRCKIERLLEYEEREYCSEHLIAMS